MYEIIDTCNEIYKRLQDEISKEIFENRILYSLTGDMKKLHNVIFSTVEGKYIKKLLMTGEKNYIFGTGTWGQVMIDTYPGCWQGLIDNDDAKNGKEISGLKIAKLEEIGRRLIDTSANIFVCTRWYYPEIYKQLLDYGIADSSIINIGKMLDDMSKKQYFDLPYLQHNKKEVFIDVGGLDAVTSLQFIEWSKGKNDGIIVFEPDLKNVEKCKDTLNKVGLLEKSKIIPKGCWKEPGVLKFNSSGSSSSAVVDATSSISTEYDEVNVTTIDHELRQDMVSFIKMDIEGSEYNALLGAENVIRTQKPKLAISVYHKREDIFSIPELILRYNPDYKFYLRHYSLAGVETVLYAI